MKKLLLILFAIPLFGATLTIDSGSSTDQYFSGGNAYTIPGLTNITADSTLRFGSSFSYRIPAADGVPYVVKLNFIEPSSAPPVRSFSVTINDQLMLTMSSMSGYLAPFARSVVAMPADGFLNVRFDSVFRSATHLPAFRSGPVISSIAITPLFEVLSTGLPVVTAWSSCHSGSVLAGPVGLGVPSAAAVWPGLSLIPTALGSVTNAAGENIGWSCDGLQAYTFKLPNGSIDGPYVAVKMPPDFVLDPTLWVKQ